MDLLLIVRLLYDVLTHPSVALVPAAPPLLVCANKSDRPGAATPAKLKAALQRELCVMIADKVFFWCQTRWYFNVLLSVLWQKRCEAYSRIPR